MKKTLYFLVITLLLLSCTSKKSNDFEYRGGNIHFSIPSSPTTWVPSLAYDNTTILVLSQVFEGLVEIDQTTYQIKPLLAKSFENSKDFTFFTFELEDNVHFHPHELFTEDTTDVVTLHDVVKTFEYACSKKYYDNTYAYQNILKAIKGAEAFHREEADTIEGIAIEDGKLIIELTQPDPLFLQKLASPTLGILSSKWINNPIGNPIGTGPFYVKEITEEEIFLQKHPQYFKKSEEGYQLPFLDELTFKIYTKDADKITDFLEGKLDVVNGLNMENLDQIFSLKKEAFNQIPPQMIYFNNPLLMTTLVLMNLETPIFASNSNRKLFNYAVNREEINRKIIHNQSPSSSIYGLIPPIEKLFNHYDYDKLKRESLTYQPKKVKAQAGQLSKFLEDTLLLHLLDDPKRIALAEFLQQQLKQELGVEIRLEKLSMEALFQSIEQMEADMYLVSFSAELLNPLSMMKHFYGPTIPDSLHVPSTVNFSRYSNWYYDQHYNRATREHKAVRQFHSILLAEKELLKNPPFIVLHYNSDNYVHYSYVCNLYTNMLNLISFREVYLKTK